MSLLLDFYSEEVKIYKYFSIKYCILYTLVSTWDIYIYYLNRTENQNSYSTKIKQKGWKRGAREILHPLVHLLNACDCWDSSQAKTRSKESIRIGWGQVPKHLDFHPLLCYIHRKLVWKWRRKSNRACWYRILASQLLWQNYPFTEILIAITCIDQLTEKMSILKC